MRNATVKLPFLLNFRTSSLLACYEYNKKAMTKLTKYNSYKSLKLSDKSLTTAEHKTFVQLPELETFFNLLQQKLVKSRKIKNDKL